MALSGPAEEKKLSIIEKAQKRVVERFEERYVDQSIDKVIDKCFNCIDCFIEGMTLKNDSIRLDLKLKEQKLQQNLGDGGGIIHLKKAKA